MVLPTQTKQAHTHPVCLHDEDKTQKRIQPCTVKPRGGYYVVEAGLAGWGTEADHKRNIAFQYNSKEQTTYTGVVDL